MRNTSSRPNSRSVKSPTTLFKPHGSIVDGKPGTSRTERGNNTAMKHGLCGLSSSKEEYHHQAAHPSMSESSALGVSYEDSTEEENEDL